MTHRFASAPKMYGAPEREGARAAHPGRQRQHPPPAAGQRLRRRPGRLRRRLVPRPWTAGVSYVTVRANVEVSLGEVAEQMDNEDLLRVLTQRGLISPAAMSLNKLPAWDWEKLVAAVRVDDGRAVIDILRPILDPTQPFTGSVWKPKAA